nr:MAG TPA: hypothetical protein [Caudoviricetes sp.]
MEHEIRIVIENTETEEDRLRKKIDRVVKKLSEEANEENKKLNKIEKIKKQIKTNVITTTENIGNISVDLANNMDYKIETAQIRNITNITKRAGRIFGDVASGNYIQAAFDILNETISGIQRGIEWDKEQQENNIQAQRSSDRLGNVSMSGNRNYKL